MRTETFHIELITPCFCGGAEPERQAEIRAPSIRGQLRWWFRTLGGFASLQPKSVREQEEMIFGSTAGDEGRAGTLIVRVFAEHPKGTATSVTHPEPQMNTPEGYVLFPLRQKARLKSALESFKLHVIWRGESSIWDDIRALVCVFANYGALGFRSRRAMGALCLPTSQAALAASLSRFAASNSIAVFAMGATDSGNAISQLASWLRGWRQHGQMWRRWDKLNNKWVPIPAAQQAQNRTQPGFPYARRDHNEGLDVQGTGAPNPDPESSLGARGQSFRPALGLPVIQFFSSLGTSHGPIPRGRATVNWNATADGGRFASPILLRPHFDGTVWRALVLFLDTRQWDYTKPVYLDSGPPPRTRQVLPDLYNEMKKHAAATMTAFT